MATWLLFELWRWLFYLRFIWFWFGANYGLDQSWYLVSASTHFKVGWKQEPISKSGTMNKYVQFINFQHRRDSRLLFMLSTFKVINKMFIRHFIGGQRWMNSFENKKKIAHWNWCMHLFRCQILSIVFRPIPFPPPLCLWHRENCIKKWIYVAYFMRIVTDFGSVLPSFDMKSICWNALRLKCTADSKASFKHHFEIRSCQCHLGCGRFERRGLILGFDYKTDRKIAW